MRNNRFFNILSIVIVFLFLVNAIVFNIKLQETFILLRTLASSVDIDANTDYFKVFYILNFVLFGGVCVLLGRWIFRKDEKQDEEIIKDQVQKKMKAEEEKRVFKEQKLKEESEKNLLIEKLLKDLEQQTTHNRYAEKFLSNLAKEFEIVQGLFFLRETGTKKFKMVGNYAFYSENEPREFEVGEGLSGQVAKNKKLIRIDNIPPDYITVLSGLGTGTPNHLIIFPILYRDESVGIVELASFSEFDAKTLEILNAIAKIIGPQLISKV